MSWFRSIFVSLCAGVCLPQTLQADLYINEIFHHPISNSSAEWIELFNSGPGSEFLADYYFDDGEGALSAIKFPPVTLQSGEYLRFNISGSSDIPNRIVGAGLGSGQLSNSGDELILYNYNNIPVDFISWGSGNPTPPPGLSWSGSISLGSPGDSLIFESGNQNNASSWGTTSNATPQGPNLPPTGSIRINEITIEGAEEWIELYYNGVNGSLRDYLISTGSGSISNLNLPDLPISGSGYAVIYLDTSGSPVADSVQLALGSNQLADAGDSVVIRTRYDNSFATSLAWGSGSAPGFLDAISIAAPYASGDSLAWLQSSGVNPANANQWINRRDSGITIGASNTEQEAPSLTIGSPSPSSNIATCDEIIIPITIENIDEANLKNITVTLDLNDIITTGTGAIGYVSLSGSGSYSPLEKVVTWIISDFAPGQSDFDITFSPGFGLTSFTIPTGAVTLLFDRYDNGSPGDNLISSSTEFGPYAITAPSFNISVTDFNNPTNDFAISSKNGFFDLLVTVTNTGTVDIPAETILAEITYGNGLSFVTVKENTSTGATPSDIEKTAGKDGSPSTVSWLSNDIEVGSSQNYYVRFRVRECIDLALDIAAYGRCLYANTTTSSTVSNSITLACDLEFYQSVPSTPITACDEFTVRWTIKNLNSIDVPLSNVSLNFNQDYYLMDVKDQNGASMNLDYGSEGDYDGSIASQRKTVNVPTSFIVPSNTGAEDELPAASSSTTKSTFIDFVFKGNCEPTSDEKTFFSITYELNGNPFSKSFSSSGITTDKPSLSINIADETDSLDTTLTGSRGDIIDFHLTITNNGDGNLLSTTSTNGAIASINDPGVTAGIEIIGVYAGLPSDLSGSPLNLIDPGTSDFNWETGAIPSEESLDYTLRVKVVNCDDLDLGATVTYSCDGRGDVPSDSCDLDSGTISPLRTANASVELLLDAPQVSAVLPGSITVAYCDDDSATTPGELVTISVENNGDGDATNVTVDLANFDFDNFDLTDAPTSQFTLNPNPPSGGTATFTLISGTDEDGDGTNDDIASGDTAVLSFYLSLKDNLVDCTPSTGDIGTIIVNYDDLCSFPYESSVNILPWYLTGSNPIPSLNASSSGAGTNSLSSAGVWTFDINHFGDPNASIDYSFEVAYPPSGNFSDFTIDKLTYESDSIALTTLTNGVDYTVDSITGTITLNVASGSGPWSSDAFDSDGIYNATINVEFTSPTVTCGSYNVTATLDWAGSPTTCKECPLTNPLTPPSDIILDYGNTGIALALTGTASINPGDNGTWSLQVDYLGLPGETFAYDVSINVQTFSITAVTDSALDPVTHLANGSNLSFSITDATFDPNGAYSETFTINYTAPDPQCDDLPISATLSVTDNTNICSTPTSDLAANLTMTFLSNPLSLTTLTITPNALISAGDSGSWIAEFVYIGTASASFDYDLVIDYPETTTDGATADFTVTSVLRGADPLTPGVDYIDDGETLTFTNYTGFFDPSGDYSESYTINYSTTLTSLGAYPTDATINVTTPEEFTPEGCPIETSFNASATTTIQGPPTTGTYAIEDSERVATYENINDNAFDLGSTVTDRGEGCTNILLVSKFDFTAGTGPSWVDITYVDTLENALEVDGDDISNLNLQIFYFDSAGTPTSIASETNLAPTAYGGTNIITASDLSYNASTNSLSIDLSNLDNLIAEPNRPDDGGWLWIQYEVVSTAASNPGTFSETATILPNESASVNLTLDNSIPAVSLERVLDAGDVSGFMDFCEPLTYRIYLTNPDLWDTYDARLVVNLGNINDSLQDFEYQSSSVSFVDLLDENGATMSAFEPSISGSANDILTWNLGDLRDLNGQSPYIEFEIIKTCDKSNGDLSVSLYTHRHCQNIDDSGLSTLDAPGDFDDIATDSESNLVTPGRLAVRWATETVYYTTGYPTVRLDIINVGGASIHNVRLPFEFGDLDNGDGLRTLSFRSAKVVDIEGSLPGVSIGSIGSSGPVRIVDVDPTESGTDGDVLTDIYIDEIGPSSIITIEVTARMHLNSNLFVHVYDATWGCDFDSGFSSCDAASPAADLNDTITILPGTTKVEVTSNTASPALLDYCGDQTQLTIRAANTGGVQAYEPILTTILAAGLVIDSTSVEYRLNGSGSFIPFSGGPASILSGAATSYSINDDGEEVISWNFSDPNEDDDDSDAILTGAGFADPAPNDSDGVGLDFFTRGRVFKPGNSVEIRFTAAIPTGDCDKALAYSTGSRQAVATIAYDIPSNHDNSVGPGPAFASDPNRDPLESSSLVSNFLEPGGVDIVANLSGQNITQNGDSTTVKVNAEIDDVIDWTFSVESIGDGNVPSIFVEIVVPTDYSVIDGPNGFTVASPATASILGTPSQSTSGGVTTYVIELSNSDFEGNSYLAFDDTLEIDFSTTVETCSTESQLIIGLVRYGCCDGVTATPLVSGASGSDIASTEINSLPTNIDISIFEGESSAIDPDDFSSCGGLITIVIENPDENNELSLNQFLIEFPLPVGFSYDPSIPTNWSYSGTGERALVDQLTEGSSSEAEPTITGGVLRWSSSDHLTNPGGITPFKAKVFPQETITLQFYLKATSAPYCDTNESSDNWSSSPGSFIDLLTFNYNNGCGVMTPDDSAIFSIAPEGADLDVILTPSPMIIDGLDTVIEWEVVIMNNGNHDAENASFVLDFGDGYTGSYSTPTLAIANTSSSTEVIGNTEDPDVLGPRGSDAHDLTIEFTGSIPAGGDVTFTINRTIDTGTRGDLSAVAIIRGECLDASGSPSCQYSYDYAPGRIAGGSFIKVIDEDSLNEPGVEVTPTAGLTGAFPVAPSEQSEEVNLTVGSIFREVYRIELFAGGTTGVELIIDLPDGFKFIHANQINSVGGAHNTIPEDDGETSGTLNFTQTINGAKEGSDALFYEIWLQVANDSSITEGGIHTITSEVQFAKEETTFTKADMPGLEDSTTVNIIEPKILLSNIDKSSNPTSLADDHTPTSGAINTADTSSIDYTVTAKNTGTSPAYEFKIEDDIPAGLSDPTGSLVISVLDAALDTDRTLILNTDYTVAPFTPSTTPGVPATMVVTFLNTPDAAIQPDETVQLEYTVNLVSVSPGAYVDNTAQITGFSSLPGEGADVSITNLAGSPLSESAENEERSDADYTTALFPIQTFHFITGDLSLDKKVRATFTFYDNGSAPISSGSDNGTGSTSFIDTDETRATIGEEIRYHIRLKIPPAVQIQELELQDTVPDGLTVTDILWEVVSDDAPFSSPNSSFPIPTQSDGETPVVLTFDQSNVWASPLPAIPLIVTTDLLVEIVARVDETYNEGTPVSSHDVFANMATFEWLTFTDEATRVSDDSNEAALTIVEPEITFFERGKSITDTSNPSIGTGSYTNFYDEGPSDPLNETDPVTSVTIYPVGTTFTYQLAIKNTGQSTAYDVVLQDLIPTGMSYDLGSVTIDSGATTPISGQTTSITNTTVNPPSTANDQYAEEVQFTIDFIEEGQTLVLEYTVTFNTPTIAGRYMQNRADIWNFSTLEGSSAFERFLDRSPTPPEYQYDPLNPVYAGVGTPFPSITKTAKTELTDSLLNGVTIGELVTYTITLDLDENLILLDPWIFDELPDGMDKIDISFNNSMSATAGVSEQGTTTDRKVEIAFDDDPVGVAAASDLIVILRAQIDDTNDANTIETAESGGLNDDGSIIASLLNSVDLSWNAIDEDPNPSVTWTNSYLNANEIRNTPAFLTDKSPTEVTLNILEPNIDVFSITQVNNTSSRGTSNFWAYLTTPEVPDLIGDVHVVYPGDEIEYTITVTNNGSVPAFDLIITDTLPEKQFVTFLNRDADPDIDADDLLFNGSTGSILTVIPSAAALDIDSVQFKIDFLLAGESATLTFAVTVDSGLGAGLYIGENSATLTDYSTLPDSSLSTTVGNLTSGDQVYDTEFGGDDDERSILLPSTDPFTVQYPTKTDEDDLGVDFPTIEQASYLLFDDSGDYVTPLTTALTGSDVIRAGDVIRFVLTVTQPPNTTLFDSPDGNALVFEDQLPRGLELRAGSEIVSFGTPATLSGTYTPSGSNPSFTSVNSNQRHRYRWSFGDIANTDTNTGTWTFSFDVDVMGYHTDDTTDLLSLTSIFTGGSNNVARLFWDTIDDPSTITGRLAQEDDFQYNGTAANNSDKPHLQTTIAPADIAQPNITVSKEAYAFDPSGSGPDFLGAPYAENDIIGITGSNGDSIVYRVTYTNTGTTSTNTGAYDLTFSDFVPEDLRPTSLTPGSDLNGANNFVAFIEESGGGNTMLSSDHDYTLSYNSPSSPDAEDGLISFLAQYDATATNYDAVIDPGDVLIIAYKMSIDPDTGATAGGVKQRVNIVDSKWDSLPSDRIDSLITSTPLPSNTGSRPRTYDDLNRTFTLHLPNPAIGKSAINPAAGESVVDGDIIEYQIVVPLTPIRADMYNVEIIDVLPDGLVFEADGSTGPTPASPSGVGLDLGATLVPGNEILVRGGAGDISINVTGRTLTVHIEKIENSDDDAPFDDDTAFDYDSDQVVITLKATVDPNGQFISGAPIPRLHEFKNVAQFRWYDGDASKLSRIRFAALSDVVSHFYNATGILFSPNHTSVSQRSTIIQYRHVVKNFEDESVNVTFSWPSSLQEWEWQLFLADANGNLIGSPQNTEYVFNLGANSSQDIVMRAFVPSETPNFATDVLEISATTSSDSISVIDITTIQDEQVVIVKDISKDGGSNFDTRLTVDPDDGQVIIQRLKFQNNGSTEVKNAYVYDFMPEHTEYVLNTATDNANYQLEYSKNGGVTWIEADPALTSETTALKDGITVVPAVTNLRWLYTGNGGIMLPSTIHEIQFSIRVK